MALRHIFVAFFLFLSMWAAGAEAQSNPLPNAEYQTVPADLQGIWAKDCSAFSRGSATMPYFVFGPDRFVTTSLFSPDSQQVFKVVGALERGNSYLISNDWDESGIAPYITIDVFTRLGPDKLQFNADFLEYHRHTTVFSNVVWRKCESGPEFSKGLSQAAAFVLPSDLERGESMLSLSDMPAKYRDLVKGEKTLSTFLPEATCGELLDSLKDGNNPHHNAVLLEIIAGWNFLDRAEADDHPPVASTMNANFQSYEGDVLGSKPNKSIAISLV